MIVTVGNWEETSPRGSRGPSLRTPRSHQIYLEGDEIKRVTDMQAAFSARKEEKNGELVATENDRYMYWTGSAKDLGDLGLPDLMVEASRQIHAHIESANRVEQR